MPLDGEEALGSVAAARVWCNAKQCKHGCVPNVCLIARSVISEAELNAIVMVRGFIPCWERFGAVDPPWACIGEGGAAKQMERHALTYLLIALCKHKPPAADNPQWVPAVGAWSGWKMEDLSFADKGPS